jgi:hypothetical protein
MGEPEEMAEALQQALESLRHTAARMWQSAQATMDRSEAQFRRADETLYHAGEHLASARRRRQYTRRLLRSAQGNTQSCSPLRDTSLLIPRQARG